MKTNAFAGVLSLLALLSVNHLPEKKEAEEFQGYQITPNPQSITYKEGTLSLKGNVNLVLDSKLDSYTVKKAYDVFSKKDILAQKSESLSDSLPNLVVSIQGNPILDNRYSADKISFIQEKTDAYFLSIESTGIYLLGKDTDACFYGLETLNQIMDQSQDLIHNLEIQDYSDSLYRGFIEGYYGIPWTVREREELMRFSSQFKMNLYVYAPKDDSYHSSNWRGLYTPSDLKLLQEEIQVGEETKVRFAWAIHPFMTNPITVDNYSDSLKIIKAKFDQVYGAGCRQFVLSADDISVSSGLFSDGSLQRRLLNDLVSWNDSKKGNGELIFVPSGYCYQSNTRLKVNLQPYFESLMNGLSNKVHIIWTGNDVCSRLSNGKFEEFTTLTGRKPLMWLNWPVNDYSTSHLLMGKAEVLDEKYKENEVPLEGIITNPMQQAEPSKIALFQVADYTWNTEAFDADTSYSRSFGYIEGKEGESLKHLASHLTNASEYDGAFFEEASDLKPLKQTIEQEISSLTVSDVTIQSLVTYYTNLEKEAEDYLTKGENQNLIESIRPWIEAIADTAKASRLYLLCYQDRNNTDKEALKQEYEAAKAIEDNLPNHKAPQLDKIFYDTVYEKVDVGTLVLTPLFTEIRDFVRNEVALDLGLFTGNVYSGFDSIYQGTLDNMTDGDDSTYCWFGSAPSENAFIRVDLGEIKDIHDIQVLYRNANGAGDYLVGDVEVSKDGRNFTKVGDSNSANVSIDLRKNPVQARYIRLVNKGTETWVSIADISINHLSMDAYQISYSGIKLEPSVVTSIENMIDGDKNTYSWFDINRTPGATFTLDLRKETTINNIYLYQTKSDSPSDMFYDLSFSYSLDGETFTPVGEASYKNMAEIKIDLSATPIEARYIRFVSNSSDSFGVVLREFGVNEENA